MTLENTVTRDEMVRHANEALLSLLELQELAKNFPQIPYRPALSLSAQASISWLRDIVDGTCPLNNAYTPKPL